MFHKAAQPDVVVYFFEADRLSGKDLTDIDFFLAQTDAATAAKSRTLFRVRTGLLIEGVWMRS